MDAILALLYPQTTTLVRMDLRASAPGVIGPGLHGELVRQPSPETLVRYDHVVVPDASTTRLQRVPVYYLTSRHTVSAAEHLALALKRTHRAVLVGETTAGANHFGVIEPFGRFAAFIPIGRTYDPDTGWDWEGKGVSPDVAIRAERALEEALKLATQEGAHPSTTE
jgi:C-terminal processing protease CtpA/Prc